MRVLLGIFIGFLAGALLYLGRLVRTRRELVEQNERTQRLQQEKEIVSGFTHNLTEGLGEDLDPAELYRRIAHAAVLGTGALSACVFIRDKDGILRSAAVEGLFPPQKQGGANPARYDTRAKYLQYVFKNEAYQPGEGIIGQAAQTPDGILVENAENDPRIVEISDPSLRLRSLVAAPMLYRRRVLGVLAVANPSDGLHFDAGDLSLIRSFAEQAALALHNADLTKTQIEKNKLDFDLALASSVQKFLLPRSFPSHEALEIDARSRPAKQVGGDLYDVFALDGDRVGAVIADVSGKGVSASLLMAICHTHLRHCFRRSDSPAEVLRAVNREMAGEMRHDMFITLVYAIVDMRRDLLTFARAGHELPLLFRKSDGGATAEKLGSEGMALGMVPPAVFDRALADRTLPFGKGDTLFLYTDGATEALSPAGEEFGAERLARSVASRYGEPLGAIADGVVADVAAFAKSDAFADDLTLLALRRR